MTLYSNPQREPIEGLSAPFPKTHSSKEDDNGGFRADQMATESHEVWR